MTVRKLSLNFKSIKAYGLNIFEKLFKNSPGNLSKNVVSSVVDAPNQERRRKSGSKEHQNKGRPLMVCCQGASKTGKPSVKTENYKNGVAYVYGNFGEDAYFKVVNPRYTIFGVADGVGGWNRHGIDPARFSRSLVQYAAYSAVELINSKKEVLPNDIMSMAYSKLLALERNAYGSSTACFAVFDREDRMLRVSNLGDSGCFIFKEDGTSIKTRDFCHSNNCPEQLALTPPGFSASMNPDMPSDAFNFKISLNKGDLVVMASDGLWDNLDIPNEMILRQFDNRSSSDDYQIDYIGKRLLYAAQAYSNVPSRRRTIKLNSSTYQRDERFGGKPDDITVITACLA